MRIYRLLCLAIMTVLVAGCESSAQSGSMSFFLTSAGSGEGADLGGLAGADAHCAALASSAGVTGKTWRAYLSTSGGGQASVNARDRIGNGPWFNANGIQVADSVADLHSENSRLGKENSVTESGNQINGRGDTPNMHDILTGSTVDGIAFTDGMDHTCSNWSSSGSDGSAQVGHHDRQGGGDNPTSWNSAHASRGCGQADLQGTGGNGLFYCFAIE